MDSFKLFEQELKKLGFFGMLKHAALTTILGSRGISNQAYYEKGIMHGKMNLFPPAEARCANGSGTNVIWIAPADIEVFWTEDGQNENETQYFFRTKSGKDFEVTEESWLRIMYGNEYRKPIAK